MPVFDFILDYDAMRSGMDLQCIPVLYVSHTLDMLSLIWVWLAMRRAATT